MSRYHLAEKIASKIIHNYFFYLFVFTLFFGVLLYNMIGIKAMDEISGLVLLLFYGIYIFTTKNKKFNAGVLITVAIFIFYFCYSIYVSNNTHQAIAIDFLIQIRPYLTFFIVSQIAPSFSDNQRLLLKRLCLIMWVFFIPVGIYGFVNPSFFYTVFEQPANYIGNIGCLSLVFLFSSNFSIRDRFIFALMLATGLLATHTNFYSFFLLTCGILLYFHHPNVFKFNLRTGIALAVITLVIIHIARAQISEYVLPSDTISNEYNLTSRSHLYKTSVDILKDFFPLGSGFASFGTLASGLYYSKIYSKYGLTSIEGLSQQDWFSVSDSYYPSLAQFGIIGIILYLFFWGAILHKAFIKFREKGDIQLFALVLILVSFVFIENISDSFFTSNKGYYMMMFLGVLFGKKKKRANLDEDNNGFESFSTKRGSKANKEKIVDNTILTIKQTSANNQPHTNEEEPIVYQMPPIPIREEDLLEKEIRAYTSQQLEKNEAKNHQIQEQKSNIEGKLNEEPYEEEEYEDEDLYEDEEYEDDFEEDEDTGDIELNSESEKNTDDISNLESSLGNSADDTQNADNNSNEIIQETKKIITIKDEISDIADEISSPSHITEGPEKASLTDRDELQLSTSLVDDEEELMELLSSITSNTEYKEVHTELQTLVVEETDQKEIHNENKLNQDSTIDLETKTPDVFLPPSTMENETDKPNLDITEEILHQDIDEMSSDSQLITPDSINETVNDNSETFKLDPKTQNDTKYVSNLNNREEDQLDEPKPVSSNTLVETIQPAQNANENPATEITSETKKEYKNENLDLPNIVESYKENSIPDEENLATDSGDIAMPYLEKEISVEETAEHITTPEANITETEDIKEDINTIDEKNDLSSLKQYTNHTDIDFEHSASVESETEIGSDIRDNTVELIAENQRKDSISNSLNETKDINLDDILFTSKDETAIRPESDLVKGYKNIVTEYSHFKEKIRVNGETENTTETDVYKKYLEELLTSTKIENKVTPKTKTSNDDEQTDEQIDYII